MFYFCVKCVCIYKDTVKSRLMFYFNWRKLLLKYTFCSINIQMVFLCLDPFWDIHKKTKTFFFELYDGTREDD